jgi:hypothetical protein
MKTEQEIKDGNILIALFMGLDASAETIKGEPVVRGKIIGGLNMCRLSNMDYHTSFDWLMTVVNKIHGMYLADKIDLIAYSSATRSNLFGLYITADIESVWSEVVSFITWYREQS